MGLSLESISVVSSLGVVNVKSTRLSGSPNVPSDFGMSKSLHSLNLEALNSSKATTRTLAPSSFSVSYMGRNLGKRHLI